MVPDLVARLQRIVETGDDGTVLRLAQLIHEIMQPGKGEGSGERPRRVVFEDIPSGRDQAKPAPEPSRPEPPTIVDRDGNEYIQPCTVTGAGAAGRFAVGAAQCSLRPARRPRRSLGHLRPPTGCQGRLTTPPRAG
jgi:hypothetical protein